MEFFLKSMNSLQLEAVFLITIIDNRVLTFNQGAPLENEICRGKKFGPSRKLKIFEKKIRTHFSRKISGYASEGVNFSKEGLRITSLSQGFLAKLRFLDVWTENSREAPYMPESIKIEKSSGFQVSRPRNRESLNTINLTRVIPAVILYLIIHENLIPINLNFDTLRAKFKH